MDDGHVSALRATLQRDHLGVRFRGSWVGSHHRHRLLDLVLRETAPVLLVTEAVRLLTRLRGPARSVRLHNDTENALHKRDHDSRQ